jgi:hypothetical protein
MSQPNPVFLAHFIAVMCSGLFAGAAIYISLVEHPARMEAGLTVALAEFGPSYRRAAITRYEAALDWSRSFSCCRRSSTHCERGSYDARRL